MSAPVSRAAWINVYKQLQREAAKISQYNHREFAHRRIRDYFELNRAEKDSARLQQLYREALEAVAQVKRQATLESLYPHQKTVVEEIVGDKLRRPPPMRECMKCKSNDYTNKNLVMLINECAHPLCKNCVDNLYVRNAAPCHVCGRMLKKNGFWEQVFEDPIIEKENNVRKRLRKIYNLKEDDFETLREYNDYLERFEMIVWNLANNVQVEETERVVAEFKEANGDLIEKNRRRIDADQEWVMEQLREEREAKRRLQELALMESVGTAEKGAAKTDTKAIMAELRQSKLPAELILDRERKRQIEAELAEKEEAEKKKKRQKELVQSRKRHMGETVAFGVSASSRSSERAFEYRKPDLPLNGPPIPVIDDLENLGYMQHMRAARPDALAGGYIAQIGCWKALQEARMDLLAF